MGNSGIAPYQGTGKQLSRNRRGPPHGALQSWRAEVEHYVGLDVSLKLTSICIVDQKGKIVREGVVASNPEAIAAFVGSHAPHVARIGLETGATSTWLCLNSLLKCNRAARLRLANSVYQINERRGDVCRDRRFGPVPQSIEPARKPPLADRPTAMPVHLTRRSPLEALARR